MKLWREYRDTRALLKTVREVQQRLAIAKHDLGTDSYSQGWRDCIDYIEAGIAKSRLPVKRATQSNLTRRRYGGTTYPGGDAR